MVSVNGWLFSAGYIILCVIVFIALYLLIVKTQMNGVLLTDDEKSTRRTIGVGILLTIISILVIISLYFAFNMYNFGY